MIFTQKVWDAFLNENNNPSFVKMANAVIEQLGGGDSDNIEQLDNVRTGSDGYGGLIYYNETAKFWKDNKDCIKENMHELAEDLGEDLITMIKGFGNFKDDDDITYDVIGEALYGQYNYDKNMYLYDTFAKYALEEVAFRFQNWLCDQDESDFDD